MTERQAHLVLATARRHFGGMGALVIPYPASPRYAVVFPAGHRKQDSLWYVLSKYDVNHIEELEAIAHAPKVMRLELQSA